MRKDSDDDFSQALWSSQLIVIYLDYIQEKHRSEKKSFEYIHIFLKFLINLANDKAFKSRK